MKYNDYELVALAKEGNEDAINIIYQKYKPIIVRNSQTAFLNTTYHGMEISDIMQEGFIGLDEAINNFSEEDNASFYTFAVLCINRQIINYIRKSNSHKDKILNEAIAIDDYVEKNLKDNFNTEISFISKENEKRIVNELEKALTPFEYEVFKFKIEGYNFDEIANTLNKDTKSIYNTFQRIKSKIKKILDEDDYLL